MNFGDLNLQDSVIITESVQYQSMAERDVSLANISRRPGGKYLSSEFGPKKILISGRIISPSASGMQGILDNIHRYLALEEQALVIDSGRTYTATCTKTEILERHYTQTYLPFAFEFICAMPFSVGGQLTAGFIVPAGSATKSLSTTISGSAFSEPVITLTTAAGAGNPGISAFRIDQITKGEYVTYSGIISLGGYDAVFDYKNFNVTYSGVSQNYIGRFSRWEIGNNDFIITVSGANTYGVTGNITYSPRYFY
jgi:phage-related protein